jgi:U3 small nucleolar ribonucleoprotein protein IMP4
MTVVTTSRKPLPEVRSLARDLGFALQERFFSRGKMGLEEIFRENRTVLIVSSRRRAYFLELFVDGEPFISVSIAGFSVDTREGEIRRGLCTGNRALHDDLKEYLNVVYTDALDPRTLAFDGTQRKHYTLTVGEA